MTTSTAKLGKSYHPGTKGHRSSSVRVQVNAACAASKPHERSGHILPDLRARSEDGKETHIPHVGTWQSCAATWAWFSKANLPQIHQPERCYAALQGQPPAGSDGCQRSLPLFRLVDEVKDQSEYNALACPCHPAVWSLPAIRSSRNDLLDDPARIWILISTLKIEELIKRLRRLTSIISTHNIQQRPVCPTTLLYVHGD